MSEQKFTDAQWQTLTACPNCGSTGSWASHGRYGGRVGMSRRLQCPHCGKRWRVLSRKNQRRAT